jgi:hypothetical protein
LVDHELRLGGESLKNWKSQMMSSKRPGSRKPPVEKLRAEKDDFVSVARRLECDEDKHRFEANLTKIAKARPAKE